MSKENVDTTHELMRATAHGDVEAFVKHVHPEIEWIPRRAPVEGSYRGHEGIRRFFEDNAETFEVFEPSPADVRDLGDRVLVIGTIRVRGKGSGIETEIPSAAVGTFQDGLLIRFEDYLEPAKALAAVGLEK